MHKPHDYVIELFHKIREDISGLKHMLFAQTSEATNASANDGFGHYTVNAVHADNQPNHEDDESVVATLNLPATIKVDAETHERHKPIHKDRPTILQALTLLAGIAVLIIYGCQLRVMDHQLTEAQKATKLSQRPWLGLDDEGGALQTTPVTFDKDGNAAVAYVTKVKNFGQFGAQGVTTYVILLVTADIISNRRAAKICEVPVAGGYVLYPGHAKATDQSTASAFKGEMELDQNGEAQAWLVGCIFARDQFGYPYHVHFIYRLIDNVTGRAKVFAPVPNLTINSGIFSLYESSMDTPNYDEKPH